MDSQFYIVATPIGNLSDISLRALEVLKSVDYIACEDTRTTKVLIDKYNIKAKLFDCHKFNEKQRSTKIISLIEEGKTIALVSDAGTPGISDPGGALTEELYKNNVKITSIPGACAISVFLSLIPRNNEEYVFIGFVPKTFKQQADIFNKYKYTNCVFYDSPNRIKDTLKNISEIFGENTKMALGRELTKVYEEVKIMSVKQLLSYYETNSLKGEIVAMIFSQEENSLTDTEIKEKINLLKQEGFSQKDISRIISKLYNENKNKVYNLSID